ncbi:Hypothetical protein NTJ_12184 [Nesidiocoris tenuis]|uniref:Uncharacterized protein n=1 Tax=Nesidiocoris tenuis TaxID=355587 RepID=A0ABN7B990_9HEMI|nr:Hypothetical protein NTJ_12184 [Nesidiocoris tenuis]
MTPHIHRKTPASSSSATLPTTFPCPDLSSHFALCIGLSPGCRAARVAGADIVKLSYDYRTAVNVIVRAEWIHGEGARRLDR